MKQQKYKSVKSENILTITALIFIAVIFGLSGIVTIDMLDIINLTHLEFDLVLQHFLIADTLFIINIVVLIYITNNNLVR